MTPRRRRVLIAAATVAAVVGFAAWLTLFRQQFPSFADDVEHFKYASVGVEAASGLPVLGVVT